MTFAAKWRPWWARIARRRRFKGSLLLETAARRTQSIRWVRSPSK